MDGGKALGTSKERFLAKYFDGDYMGYKFTPKPDASERIANDISGFTFRVENADYEDQLPTLIEDYKFIRLNDESRVIYDDMRKHMISAIGDTSAVAVNEAVKSGKLQQIACGFAYSEDQTLEIHGDKVSAVITEINSAVNSGQQVMVVYTYLWELEWLQETYKDALWLGNGVSKTQARHVKGEWNTGRLNILLLHPKSGGHGLNLQYSNACRIIFTTPIWSKDQNDQVVGRLRRRGNKSKYVRVTYVVATNTVEDKVMVPRLLSKGDGAKLFAQHLRDV